MVYFLYLSFNKSEEYLVKYINETKRPETSTSIPATSDQSVSSSNAIVAKKTTDKDDSEVLVVANGSVESVALKSSSNEKQVSTSSTTTTTQSASSLQSQLTKHAESFLTNQTTFITTLYNNYFTQYMFI